jgi:hypothetical protein
MLVAFGGQSAGLGYDLGCQLFISAAAQILFLLRATSWLANIFCLPSGAPEQMNPTDMALSRL